MSITATLKIRPEPGVNRPSRDRVAVAAEQLRSRGFNVLHAGRVAITICGSNETFADEFRIKLKHDRQFVGGINPRSAVLADLVEAIEVGPPPTLLR